MPAENRAAGRGLIVAGVPVSDTELSDPATVGLRVADDSRPASSRRVSELVGSVGWAIVDAAPDGILLVEHSGEIVLANARAESIFGYEPGGLLNCSLEQLLPTRLRAGHEEHRAAYAVAPVSRPMGAGLLLHGVRADGGEFPIEVSLSPFNGGSARLTIAIVREASDARVARETATELVLSQERERLAHELLNSIIRRLFDVGLTLAGHIADQREVGDAELRAMMDEIDETVREIRRIVFDVRGHQSPRPDY